MTDILRTELLELLKNLSFKKGDFTLASGKKSDYFIDVKQTALRGEGHLLIGQVLFERICELQTNKDIRLVAGVALGGCPLASAVSIVSTFDAYNKDFPILDALYIRKEVKDHGTKNLIEGWHPNDEGENVVLLEDTLTTGASSAAALKALFEAKYNPVCVLALVDRQEGGKEAIDKEFGIPVFSIYTVDELRETK